MSGDDDQAADQAAGLRRRFPVAAQPVRPPRSVLLAARRRRPDVGRFRAALRLGDLRRQHAQLLPLPDAGRQRRLFRRGRPQRQAVPAAQSAAQRPVPLRLRRARGIRSSAMRRCIPASTGPRRSGTPIIAAGNGVVEKAGWAGGYGRQTIIRHANGYETSYNHQSAIANGIKPGAQGAPGPGDRLCRLDRARHRRASPLRADRQRHQGRPDAGAPADRQGRSRATTSSPSSRSATASTRCSRKRTTVR